jgi:hypothetical protein
MAKTARFLSGRVTEEFKDIAEITKERYTIADDTELMTTAVEFLNLASDDQFKEMTVSDFLKLFFKIKKGKNV